VEGKHRDNARVVIYWTIANNFYSRIHDPFDRGFLDIRHFVFIEKTLTYTWLKSNNLSSACPRELNFLPSESAQNFTLDKVMSLSSKEAFTWF